MNRCAAFIIILLAGMSPGLAQDLWYSKGETAFDAGNYQGAVDAFSRGIGQCPGNAALYIIRGIAYNRLGSYDQALKDYDKAIELKPVSIFYSGPEMLYTDPGNRKRYLSAYDRAIRVYPVSLAYWCRGNIHTGRGELNKALRDYNNAIRAYSKNGAAYFGRGNAYQRLGKKIHAREDWRRAADLGHQGARRLIKQRGIR